MKWRPFGHRDKPFSRRPVESEITPQGGPDQTPVVEWLVNRCPFCSSKKIRTTNTLHVGGVTVRHHSCRGCAGRYKSAERQD